MTNHNTEAAVARELEALTSAPAVDARSISMAAAEPASRVALLAELEDLRLLFIELREECASPAAKTARLTSHWTALDVVAHLASWAAETRREAEALLAGDRLDYAIHFEREGGPRAWNQREVDARATRGLSELVEELVSETDRLADLVLAAPQTTLEQLVELPRTSGDPPQRWRMPFASMVGASCWHARLHLRKLLPGRAI